MVRISTIVVAPAIFGAMGFLYSLIGLAGHPNALISLEPFRSLTVQEIGGHVSFGFLAALPSRNLKLALICGLMAITIDTDHILNAMRIPVEGRIDHSIPFAIISPIAIGFLAARLDLGQPKRNGSKNAFTTARLVPSGPIFWKFFVLTLAAFMAHIAYDTILDDHALFPILAPFSFNLVMIPRAYGLVIEAAAGLLTYVSFRRLSSIITARAQAD